jgi:hypothetical protein
MLRQIGEYIAAGWKVLTEAHTALFLLSLLGLPVAAIPVWLGWENQDSRPWLVVTGALVWAAVFLCILGFTGYSRRGLRPSFEMSVDGEQPEVRLGGKEGFVRLCSVKIRNISGQDLDSCIVQLERIDIATSIGLSLPMVLRTDGQIQSDRTGRFKLSNGQTKAIHVLFAAKRRRNEWFMFDEHKHQFYLPASPLEMEIAVYGARTNVAGKIKAEVGQNWEARFFVGETRVL